MSMMCALWVILSTTAFARRASGNTFVHSPERQVGGDDQRCSLVALGDDLEDELRGAGGQREITKLVKTTSSVRA